MDTREYMLNRVDHTKAISEILFGYGWFPPPCQVKYK